MEGGREVEQSRSVTRRKCARPALLHVLCHEVPFKSQGRVMQDSEAVQSCSDMMETLTEMII